ncbi:Beta-Casp domain-containing protein [Meloidogyne graminicola]|uniref:Beta-Casp domain-containing protein n=1 Tax=Meloidogyne graminicola TaxID=189291 RepID=A0A8S9ZB36_9BILA|nr:Beta-Casp domain-containing protein [Meloidogyne graminicola]
MELSLENVLLLIHWIHLYIHPPIQQSFSSQLPEEYDDNFNIYSNRFDESFDVLGEDEDQQQQPIDDIECNSGTVYPFSFF